MIAWRSRGADALVVLAFVLGVLCMSRALAGCGPTAEATYGGQLALCVKRAHTRAESRACRAEVDARWGLTDGGADAAQP